MECPQETNQFADATPIEDECANCCCENFDLSEWGENDDEETPNCGCVCRADCADTTRCPYAHRE